MKSKKSIFVVALAALMLIAFTACEQAPIEMPKSVINAAIRQTGIFLEGQAFDSSKFAVDVTYSDKTTETISGANVVTLVDATKGVKNGVNVQATIGKGSSTAVTYYGSLTAYTVDSFTVTQNATYYSDTEAEDISAADFTIVANYTANGSAATYTVTPSEYTVNEANIAIALNGATGLTADNPTVTVKSTSGIQVFGENIETELTVSFKPSSGDKIVDINVEVADTSAAKAAAIQRGAFTPATMLVVTPVYENGYEATTALSFGTQTGYTLTATLANPLKIDNPSSTESSGSVVRFGETSTNAVNVTIVVSDPDTKELTTITKQVQIPTRADYVTTMTASKVENTTWKPNAPITYNQFTISATAWASGYQNAVADYSTKPEAVPANAVKFDKTNAPATTGTFSVTVSYVINPTYSDAAASQTVSDCSVVE